MRKEQLLKGGCCKEVEVAAAKVQTSIAMANRMCEDQVVKKIGSDIHCILVPAVSPDVNCLEVDSQMCRGLTWKP